MSRRKLARHQLIAFPVQQTPLRVTDDRVLATDVLEHRRRNLAGERTLTVRAHVLRAKVDGRITQHPPHFLQVHVRRTHDTIRSRIGRILRPQLLDQPRVIGARSMHFPVSDDDGAAHCPTSRFRGRAMIATDPPWCNLRLSWSCPGAARRRASSPARFARYTSAAAFTTSASSVAAARVALSPLPSTITRMTGSVPEARKTTRPSAPMRFSIF